MRTSNFVNFRNFISPAHRRRSLWGNHNDLTDVSLLSEEKRKLHSLSDSELKQIPQGVNSVTVRGDSLWQLSMMLYEKGYRFFTLGQWFFTSFYAHAKRGVKMVIFDSFRVKFC